MKTNRLSGQDFSLLPFRYNTPLQNNNNNNVLTARRHRHRRRSMCLRANNFKINRICRFMVMDPCKLHTYTVYIGCRLHDLESETAARFRY